MNIHFLGVGEACDGNQPNTSMLLRTDNAQTGGRVLLDCGFSVPHQYFSLDADPDELEVLWISHFHGDHFFGTPLLLLWFWEMGRRKQFQLVGPPGLEKIISRVMELAYPGLAARLGFSLLFTEITPGEQKNIAGYSWQAAYNEHSQPCLSLRLGLHDKVIFYSGDGRPTPSTQSLARNADIIIHEAYGLKDNTPGHGSIGTCLEFAANAGVKTLALLHMQRDMRLQAETAIAKLKKKYPEVTVLMPEKGSTLPL